MIAAERGVVAMAQDRSDTDAIRFQRTGEPVAASSSRADFRRSCRKFDQRPDVFH